jgi:hypothetical protein
MRKTAQRINCGEVRERAAHGSALLGDNIIETNKVGAGRPQALGTNSLVARRTSRKGCR